jgi:DNA-binding PadR family transcriptional regulator
MPKSDNAAVQELLPLPPATFHILLALSAGDRHGYGIIQDVEARTGGMLRLSPLEQGLITEPTRRDTRLDDPRRRYYRITVFGRTVARADAERLAHLVGLARGVGLLGGTS